MQRLASAAPITCFDDNIDHKVIGSIGSATQEALHPEALQLCPGHFVLSHVFGLLVLKLFVSVAGFVDVVVGVVVIVVVVCRLLLLVHGYWYCCLSGFVFPFPFIAFRFLQPTLNMLARPVHGPMVIASCKVAGFEEVDVSLILSGKPYEYSFHFFFSESESKALVPSLVSVAEPVFSGHLSFTLLPGDLISIYQVPKSEISVPPVNYTFIPMKSVELAILNVLYNILCISGTTVPPV
ncbi:hypothetical protein Tco_0530775 [Tanacetum coccineum]